MWHTASISIGHYSGFHRYSRKVCGSMDFTLKIKNGNVSKNPGAVLIRNVTLISSGRWLIFFRIRVIESSAVRFLNLRFEKEVGQSMLTCIRVIPAAKRRPPVRGEIVEPLVRTFDLNWQFRFRARSMKARPQSGMRF
jgi:hypothetical protein